MADAPQGAGRPLRLGTRGSKLALVQARLVRQALDDAGAGPAEIVELVTTGDRDRGARDKAKWVRELDRALLAGEIDLAVHSAKDVPGELTEGIALVGTLPREDPHDALIGAESLAALPQGAVVGTSSLRRGGQLLALRGDLKIVELRGNVDTRLGKVDAGEVDAAVLACAGLARLGLAGRGVPIPELVPAAGQGIVVIAGRAGDRRASGAAIAISDAHAMTMLRAERSAAIALGADCDTAVGAWARALDDDRMELIAVVVTPDGSRSLRDMVEGPIEAAELLGASIAGRLRSAGADELLALSRRQAT